MTIINYLIKLHESTYVKEKNMSGNLSDYERELGVKIGNPNIRNMLKELIKNSVLIYDETHLYNIKYYYIDKEMLKKYIFKQEDMKKFIEYIKKVAILYTEDGEGNE